MTVRVMLISPAMNAALREARFDGDSALDRSGRERARAAADTVPAAGLALSGPSVRCRETAEALGLATARTEPALAGWDLARWAGRRLDEVAAAEAAEVAAWLGDPAAAPHGGESLHDLIGRTGAWLDSLDEPDASTTSFLAVAETAVVRAAVVHGLRLPPEAFWRLDVAPLTLTELSGRSGRWNVGLGRPLTAPPAG
ncbi:histidine phosphatase family protein [Streptomyces sp. NPDC057644]|uniref:histidine phosphatase family protein n=1 Tax=Streptomyces sp. NPDC057644 TaxID=3346191 RepID=UPI0036A06B36